MSQQRGLETVKLTNMQDGKQKKQATGKKLKLKKQVSTLVYVSDTWFKKIWTY
jgi:hypothetical protein